jgi:acetolactate synthase-1/2/3 large subunit
VASVVVDALARAGARRAFVATAAHPLAAAAARRLATVEVADPHAAAIMAAVTAALDDAPGVAVVGDGASATAALAHAGAAGLPLVLVTGGEGDAPAEPRLKAVAAVDADSAAHWAAHAVQRALTEPRGPVVIQVPEFLAGRPTVPVATAVRPALPPPDGAALAAAVDLLSAAARPVLVTGRQCRFGGTAAWLRPFAESLPAPVLSTVLGKGTLPDPHPLAFGVLGLTPVQDALLERADLVVTVGVAPGEVEAAPWRPGVPVLHLGATTAGEAAWRPAAAVVAEPPLILEELAPGVRAMARADWDVAALDRLKRLLHPRPGGVLDLRALVALVREAAPAGSIAAADPDLTLADVVTAWQCVSPADLLLPLGLARPPFARPAGGAAALAASGRPVIAFTGDADAFEDPAAIVVALAPDGAARPPGSAALHDAAAVQAAVARRLADAAAGPLVIRAAR